MLPQLACDGPRVVERDSGRERILRGVNVSGMEYSDVPLAGVTPDELTTIVRGWGASVVRIPFVQSRVLEGNDYVDELREITRWLGELGAYTILDLQWLDREKVWGPGDNRVAPEPNDDSVTCWAKLSQAFRGETAVVFDLFNEPHDIDAPAWNAWAARLLAAARGEQEQRVVMVSGIAWASDLRGVHVEGPDLIYAAHVYPWMSQDWWTYFGHRAEEAPLFIAEWGGEAKDLTWGRRLAAYMRSLGLGWTAWSWRDKPHLQQHGLPTEFGDVVMAALHERG